FINGGTMVSPTVCVRKEVLVLLDEQHGTRSTRRCHATSINITTLETREPKN
ncbi:hypothetical protein A2U01_0056944, partial [Trifolium medium]|nr:hypothetical protein [Trifolium medium]